MKRTVVSFSSHFDQMKIGDHFIFMGSCFSNNIGKELSRIKISASVNPFGIIFHPIALFKVLKRVIDKNSFTSSDFFERDCYWFNYELGSSIGFESRAEAVRSCNLHLDELHDDLLKAKKIFITFGSAYGYVHNQQVVANCHKMPSHLFSKELSTISSITEAGESFLEKLAVHNPAIQIVFTVSPIRHVKDSLEGNCMSKAILRLACNDIVKENVNTEYFPVFEKVMDELRDYSFYKRDGIHLNEHAIEQIFSWFKSIFFDELLLKRSEEVVRTLQKMDHQSLFPKSKTNRQFKGQLLLELERQNGEKNIDWTLEIQSIKNQLKDLE